MENLVIISDQHVEAHRWIGERLPRGETIVWIGKPGLLRVANQYREILVSRAAVVLVALAVYLGGNLVETGQMPERELSIAAFVGGLILFMAWLRPVYSIWMARKTIYAVTEKRALIVKQRLFGNRTTADYSQPLHIQRRDLVSLQGDLIFTNIPRKEWHVMNRLRPEILYEGFYGIDNVQSVEKWILQAIPGSTSTVKGKGL